MAPSGDIAAFLEVKFLNYRFGAPRIRFLVLASVERLVREMGCIHITYPFTVNNPIDQDISP